MHAEMKRVIDSGAWGVASSIFAGVISPAEFQVWFQTAGSIGGTLVMLLSLANLVWIFIERAKGKRKD